MTGHGQGRSQVGSAEVTVEVRAVNNRHLKIQLRTSDALSALDHKIEALVRKALRRGSLQIAVQLHGGQFTSSGLLSEEVISSYVSQCNDLSQRLGLEEAISLRDVLQLPGAVVDPKSNTVATVAPELEECVLGTVGAALENLNEMRKTEGASMTAELTRQLENLVDLAGRIADRSPQVVEEYRERLSGKLTRALAEVGAQLQESDVVREVLIMADKADIREEVVRLNSHFEQFSKLLQNEQSQGRKLDFLIQEMFRETNTIGSKAGDAQIAQLVVDMKTVIEQVRELVQNAE